VKEWQAEMPSENGKEVFVFKNAKYKQVVMLHWPDDFDCFSLCVDVNCWL